MDIPLSNQRINQQKKVIWLKSLLALLIFVLLAYAVNWVFSPSVKRDKLRTAKVSTQTISSTINAGGLVVPITEESIASETASFVSRVFVLPGQRVEKGQKLLQLDTQKINLEIDNINENVALKNSQINTKKLQTGKDLNDINSRIELLEVDLESRITKLDKLNQLKEVGAFSSQDLLEAQLNVKRTTIEMRQLHQSIADLRSTTQAEIDTLELEKTILLKSLKEQQRLQQAASVIATRNGVVSWINQEEGSSVNAGQTIAKIVDDSEFRIEATLSDFYASQLVPNMKAEINYQNQTLIGKLTDQAPTIENGVMKLSIALDRPNNDLLRNNLRVDVGLVTKTLPNTLALNKGPYVSGSGIQDVFVIKDNVAYRTQIEIGHGSATIHQIKSGLKEHDEVIISDVSDYLHLAKFAVN